MRHASRWVCICLQIHLVANCGWAWGTEKPRCKTLTVKQRTHRMRRFVRERRGQPGTNHDETDLVPIV